MRTCKDCLIPLYPGTFYTTAYTYCKKCHNQRSRKRYYENRVPPNEVPPNDEVLITIDAILEQIDNLKEEMLFLKNEIEK
jgi:hypothetical protein